MNEELGKNLTLINWYKFFRMFMLLLPLIIPFFEFKELTMAEVYLLQSCFALTIFIFEIPSGYLCDLLGRKKSLVLSSILAAIGFSIFPIAQGFTHLVIAEIVLGIGLSLSSGTDTSLIYDTLTAINSKKAKVKVLGQSLFYSSLGETISSLLAVAVFSISTSLNMLAIISAVISWVPLFIALQFKEPPRTKMDRKDHKGNLKYIIKKLFKESAPLNIIIINIVFYSNATLLAVWAFQKQWQELEIPLEYFGYLWAATNLTVALTAKYAHKIEKHIGSSITIIMIGVLPVLGYLGIGYVTTLWGVGFCLLFQICRGLNSVILRDALNKRVTGDFRATANSISQMGSRTLFMVLGPIVGHIIDRHTLNQTMIYLGQFYAVVFFLAIIPLLFQKKNYITIKN